MAEPERRGRWAALVDVAFGALLPLHLFTLLDLSVIEPHDFWWHVRTGQRIALDHAIPTVDSYSFITSGARFVNEPWLAQLSLWELYSRGGFVAVVLVHALTISAGYALVWRSARRASPTPTVANVALASAIAATVGAAHWGVRPQSFSLLGFGALVWTMERHRRGAPLALYASIPLFALWVNLHGGFAFGLLALGLYCAWQLVALYRQGARRAAVHTAVAGLLALLACGVNPQGPMGPIEHVAMFFRRGGAGVSANSEFVPLSIKTADGIVFAFGVVRLLVALWRGATLPAPAHAVLLLVFGALTVLSVRFEPYFGFVLLLPLAAAMQAEDSARKRPVGESSTPLRALAVAVSFALAVATVPVWRHRLPLPDSRRSLASAETPFSMTTKLCALSEAGERVFADQGFASYVIFACPRAKVFLDTRVQLFDAATWDEYDAVIAGGPAATEVLNRHKVTLVMLRRDQSSAESALKASGEWRFLAEDGVASLWSRAPHAD